MDKPQILISAGEASGDMYAARLSCALAQRTGARLFGMGGPKMREAGVELVADSADVAVVGISEVLRKIPDLRRTLRRLEDEARVRKPHLAVLTDFPGFHLRLARKLRRWGVRNVYFISPQFWAWRPWRARLIRRRFERALCIFPFEPEFYAHYGVRADFIGHPLVDSVRANCSRAEFAARHGLDPEAPVIVLLPGSRPGEIAHNLPVLIESCRELEKLAPGACEFVVALAPGISRSEVARQLPPPGFIHLVENATYDAVAAADVAVVSSGTATVEAALLGTPMVVIYRVAPATAFLLRRLVRTPHFAMPNLIAGRKIVPELFQLEFAPRRVAEEVQRLLTSPEKREQMKRDLAEVRRRLGAGGAVERAAEIIAGML